MQDFATLLNGSAEAHGHLCPGQVVGVRMAVLGCKLIGLDEPRSLPQIKNLLVYVEIDRCATDAISFVTGVKLGRRSLKFMDYGIMAASFMNLETQKAFRILSTEDARALAPLYAPEVAGKSALQLAAYQRMPDSVIFRVQQIKMDVNQLDLPGPTRRKVACQRCGQVIRDGREVICEEHICCKPCAAGAYYSDPQEFLLKDLDNAPDTDPLRYTQIRHTTGSPKACPAKPSRSQSNPSPHKDI